MAELNDVLREALSLGLQDRASMRRPPHVKGFNLVNPAFFFDDLKGKFYSAMLLFALSIGIFMPGCRMESAGCWCCHLRFAILVASAKDNVFVFT